MVVQVVGLIIVIALLTIPPYIAEKYTKSLNGMIYTTGGLWMSCLFAMTSGAVIIFLAGIVFFLSLALDEILLLAKRGAVDV